jgi:predicted ATPase
LQLLACLGNSAEFRLLEITFEQTQEEMHARLWDARRAGFILQTESSYRFLHDRIREAAYGSMPPDVRIQTHLRIGRLLATRIAPEERDEAIFEIVNQLNRGATLITAGNEREQLAEFNLNAGKRAKASTAYSASREPLSWLPNRGAVSATSSSSWNSTGPSANF